VAAVGPLEAVPAASVRGIAMASALDPAGGGGGGGVCSSAGDSRRAGRAAAGRPLLFLLPLLFFTGWGKGRAIPPLLLYSAAEPEAELPKRSPLPHP
jgi:hypothetical protein